MQIIRHLGALRELTADWRKAGQRVALVPTMGALHDGHLSLVAEARRRANRVVVSIFVNPTQFGPNEDLARYPRRESTDAALLTEAGCDLLWLPDVGTMYPSGFATTVSVKGISEGLCGTVRPGHFDGVATVVAKLFGQVRPDVALFGEKDYQQLMVIRRMTQDLDMAVEICGVPTLRDDQGLALSSRNAYLDPPGLATARALPRTLGRTAAAIMRGEPVDAAVAAAREQLLAAGFDSVDYVELRAADTLAPLDRLDRPGRLLAAARLGSTRLIDNIAVSADSH